MAKLERYWDGHYMSTLDLKKRDYLVGRDPECDLVLEDPFSSRRHFQICWVPEGHYVLKDLGTPNGTVVNGVREFQRKLTWDATIQVGRELLRFRADEDGTELSETDTLPGWAIVGSQNDNINLDATGLLAPAALNRLQARVRARQRPHLLLRVGTETLVFPLDTSTTSVGFGPVRASLGPSKDGEEKVMAEVVRSDDGSFRIRAKGLFGRVEVNGVGRKECVLAEGDRIKIQSTEIEFHQGLAESAG